MAASGVGPIIRHLRRTVLRHDRAGMTDGQLLEDFITHRDEAAFEALVRRHGPMVLGVCRRVLHHPQDAEDASQAAFLVLARKAASVSPPEMLGNWLFGVARTTALRARVANAKRRVREKQVTDVPEPEARRQDLWDDVKELLDEELARLPDKYRVPVVLCDLEGRTRREVAGQLKVPEGTLSSRLTTARRTLAKRLTRRGLAVSGGSLAMAVSREAASARVPASLLSATVKAATLVAAGQAATGSISAQVVALTQGVLKSMFLSKLKSVVVVLLVIAALGGAAGLSFQTRGEEPQTPEGTGQSPASEVRTGGQTGRANSALPQIGPLPLAVDFGFPVQRADDAKGKPPSVVRFIDGGTAETNQLDPPKYKGIFVKVLTVVAEHFEQITYANQYDGRIEARTVAASRSGIIREATVSLQPSDDGGLSITAQVNKVKTGGDKSEIIGRDSDLEQVILDMRTAQEMRKETQGRRFRGAGEEVATPHSQQGPKETPRTTTPPSDPRTTLAASGGKKGDPKADPPIEKGGGAKDQDGEAGRRRDDKKGKEPLRDATRQELTTVVPHFFTVAYPKKNLWLRVDDHHWVERYPDGTESGYEVLGRTKARGRPGVVISKVSGDPKKTGNENDGSFQVFIPDKGAAGLDVLFRHVGQADDDWYFLGVMRGVE
jgi:RNA polymerase sigma factor (sigma-70 family)